MVEQIKSDFAYVEKLIDFVEALESSNQIKTDQSKMVKAGILLSAYALVESHFIEVYKYHIQVFKSNNPVNENLELLSLIESALKTSGNIDIRSIIRFLKFFGDPEAEIRNKIIPDINLHEIPGDESFKESKKALFEIKKNRNKLSHGNEKFHEFSFSIKDLRINIISAKNQIIRFHEFDIIKK